jgi:hypothetical protein
MRLHSLFTFPTGILCCLIAARNVGSINPKHTGFVGVGNEVDSVTKLRPVTIAKSVVISNLSPIIERPALSSIHDVGDIILVALVVHDDVHNQGFVQSEDVFTDLALPRRKNVVLVQRLPENRNVVSIAHVMSRCFAGIHYRRRSLKFDFILPVLIAGSVNGHTHIGSQLYLRRSLGGNYSFSGEESLPGYEKQGAEDSQSRIAIRPREYSAPY